jgi:hypothetical protein
MAQKLNEDDSVESRSKECWRARRDYLEKYIITCPDDAEMWNQYIEFLENLIGFSEWS